MPAWMDHDLRMWVWISDGKFGTASGTIRRTSHLVWKRLVEMMIGVMIHRITRAMVKGFKEDS